jgi:hypothetical protein
VDGAGPAFLAEGEGEGGKGRAFGLDEGPEMSGQLRLGGLAAERGEGDNVGRSQEANGHLWTGPRMQALYRSRAGLLAGPRADAGAQCVAPGKRRAYNACERDFDDLFAERIGSRR